MTALGLRDQLTHRGNLRDLRYGWLRLTPMYSVHLVEELLSDDLRGADGKVLDPFCGTGTTALVCGERGIESDTTDINPFLLWLTKVKTTNYEPIDLEVARSEAYEIALAARHEGTGTRWIPPLRNIEKWWDEDMLGCLSRAWERTSAVENERVSDLLTVAFLRTVIQTAHVSFGHQSMSFKARKVAQVGPFELFADKWQRSVESVLTAAEEAVKVQPRALLCDARELKSVLQPESYASVITSPPYCNRMSYIRELRPYMYWLGYLADGRAAGELDWQAIGGTWGIATSNLSRWTSDENVRVPHAGFQRILDEVDESSEVLSTYIAKYFQDAVLHVEQLVDLVASRGSIHYIVGNSKFYQCMVPVERIYADIFAAAGFEDVTVQAIRKRTSKKELFEYLVSASKP